jgi:hypothetical protein
MLVSNRYGAMRACFALIIPRAVLNNYYSFRLLLWSAYYYGDIVW